MSKTTTYIRYSVTSKYTSLIKGLYGCGHFFLLDYIDLLEKKSNVFKHIEKCYNFEDKIFGFFLNKKERKNCLTGQYFNHRDMHVQVI